MQIFNADRWAYEFYILLLLHLFCWRNSIVYIKKKKKTILWIYSWESVRRSQGEWNRCGGVENYQLSKTRYKRIGWNKMLCHFSLHFFYYPDCSLYLCTIYHTLKILLVKDTNEKCLLMIYHEFIHLSYRSLDVCTLLGRTYNYFLRIWLNVSIL